MRYPSYLLKSALELDKKIFVPKVTGNEMIFYLYDKDSEFTVSSYGIREPNENKNDLFSYIDRVKSKIKILNITPALCVDHDLYRLGYGGGFYDRFLAGISLKAGSDVSIKNLVPIYSGFVLKSLPHDDNDKKIDMIVTEKKGDIRELQRD